MKSNTDHSQNPTALGATGSASAFDHSALSRRVAELADRLQAGEQIDLKAFCSDCPEQFEQLEMLLPTLQAVVDLERSLAGSAVRGSPDPTHPAISNSPPPDTGEGLGEGVRAAGLLGDFRILREVGRGGMGVVYEAEQISLGRRVALKVLPFAAMLDRQQLARFKNEARAAATLDHPNIVAIYSVGAERGVHYYTMQLIEGQSLAQVIEQLKRDLPNFAQQNGTVPLLPRRERGSRSEPGEGAEHRDRSEEPGARIDKVCPPPLHGKGFSDTAPIAQLSTLPAFSSKEYFRTIAQLGIQAAEALDHAHQNGILHRDIKPANLLVEGDCPILRSRGLARFAQSAEQNVPVPFTPSSTNTPGTVPILRSPWSKMGLSPSSNQDASHLKLWITDFGLARMEQDAGMTLTGDILGTLRYMSPEQALAKRVVADHRSDIYSLGVTLYELLTLQPAFTGDDRQELLRQIAFDEPRKPRQINAHIAPDLETIILKSIEKDPSERYATAQELAADLRRYIDDRPVVARRASLAHRARKWARRHVGLLASAATILLLIAVATGTAALLVARERTVAQQNAVLARQTLEETLAPYVLGDLASNELGQNEKVLLRRGIEFYKQYARQNNIPLAGLYTYQRLLRTQLLDQALATEELTPHEETNRAYLKAIRQAEVIVATFANTSGRGRSHNAHFDVAVCRNCFAVFLLNREDLRGAKEQLLSARATFEKFHKRAPNSPAYAYELGVNHYNMAKIDTAAGDLAKAESSYRTALPLLQQSVDRAPESESYRKAFARAQYNLAHLMGSAGLTEEAEKLWQGSLAEWRYLAENHPKLGEYPSRTGATLNNLAILAWKRDELDSARQLLEEALVYQKRALSKKPLYHRATDFLEQHYLTLRGILRDQRDQAALDSLGKDRAATMALLTEKAGPSAGGFSND